MDAIRNTADSKGLARLMDSLGLYQPVIRVLEVKADIAVRDY